MQWSSMLVQNKALSCKTESSLGNISQQGTLQVHKCMPVPFKNKQLPHSTACIFTSDVFQLPKANRWAGWEPCGLPRKHYERSHHSMLHSTYSNLLSKVNFILRKWKFYLLRLLCCLEFPIHTQSGFHSRKTKSFPGSLPLTNSTPFAWPLCGLCHSISHILYYQNPLLPHITLTLHVIIYTYFATTSTQKSSISEVFKAFSPFKSRKM